MFPRFETGDRRRLDCQHSGLSDCFPRMTQSEVDALNVMRIRLAINLAQLRS